jgi:integrase
MSGQIENQIQSRRSSSTLRRSACCSTGWSPARWSPPTRRVPSADRSTSSKTGKTTVLDADQARKLLDSIDTTTVVGLRDRALISVMTFAFARIGAVVAMHVEDYYPMGKRWWLRLHE